MPPSRQSRQSRHELARLAANKYFSIHLKQIYGPRLDLVKIFAYDLPSQAFYALWKTKHDPAYLLPIKRRV